MEQHETRFDPPPALRPDTTGRKTRILRNEEKRAWSVEIGPTEAGMGARELMAEAEEHPERFCVAARPDFKTRREHAQKIAGDR